MALVDLKQFGKSFMYKRKRIGPRLDPCGTAHPISLASNSLQFIAQICFLLLRYDLNHSNITNIKYTLVDVVLGGSIR